MKKRIVFGSMMIAALTALLWWDFHLEAGGASVTGLPLAILTALLLIGGYLEYARLARAAGLPAMVAVGVVCAVAVGLTPLWGQLVVAGSAEAEAMVLLVLGGVVAVVFAAQMAGHRIDAALRRVAGTLGGVAYLGVLAAGMLALRVRFGMPALVLFLVSVKGADIGAYFTGSFIGRHKMIPWLSPGKTWEGLAGGGAPRPWWRWV